jgi:hypothetical protein
MSSKESLIRLLKSHKAEEIAYKLDISKESLIRYSKGSKISKVMSEAIERMASDEADDK